MDERLSDERLREMLDWLRSAPVSTGLHADMAKCIYEFIDIRSAGQAKPRDDEQPACFDRGSIVREFGDGPNMLVVRSSADHTFVVVCEGDNDGTLRAREYPTGDLDQVLGNGAQQDRELDLRWKAQMRAIARWRDANPGNDLVMPDHADLVVWLLDQLAAGPVMPEMPTAEALNAAYQAGHMDLDHSHRTYDAIRAALMK